MNALTKKQTAILDFIERFRKEHGISPTLREIMSNFQFNSTSTCWKHIDNLKKKGVLTQDPKKWRSILLKEENPESPNLIKTVTVIGKISRNLPVDFLKNVMKIQIPSIFFASDHHRYGLLIKDRSFEHVHALKNDLLIIQNKPPLQNEELVFCLDANNTVDLIAYEDISDLDCIQGVVTGLLRYWKD